jgi:hypothetical protein
LEGLSNKHLTKILLRNPHPQACLVGALESISPDPETSSDFWNHRKLLLHQWHQVTSSDIKWHQGFAVHSVGCWESERGPQRWSQWSKPKYSRLKRPESGQLTAVRGRIFEKII